MKAHRIVFTGMMMFLLFTSAAFAGDFDWLQDLNIRAEADPSGFRVELATRFKIGNAEINAVISNVEKPADAYMVLRLGEMSQQPADYVIKKYQSGRGHGWGVLAKSLGIKPGSREFHALKRGHDLYGSGDIDTGNGRGKGRGRGPK
ncbi:MAG TPA: hypothetical protein VN944_06225 [Nitrospiria bacterium]|nr:hypothetical protein [Nitrospiria bacterium]